MTFYKTFFLRGRGVKWAELACPNPLHPNSPIGWLKLTLSRPTNKPKTSWVWVRVDFYFYEPQLVPPCKPNLPCDAPLLNPSQPTTKPTSNLSLCDSIIDAKP